MRFKIGDKIGDYLIEAIDTDGTIWATVDGGERQAVTATRLEAIAAAAATPAPASTNPTILEAAASDRSLNERLDAVRQAVSRRYNSGPGEYCYTEVVFDDFVIVRRCAGPGLPDKLWQIAYAVGADGVVTFTGEPVEVRVAYQPVKGAASEAVGDGMLFGPVLEADGKPTGKRWNVLIIQEGLSLNRSNYGREVLRDAVAKYEGARMYIDHPESERRFGRSMKDLAGFLRKPQAAILPTAEGDGASLGRFAIAGTAIVTHRELREALLDAWNEGAADLFGLSHVVECQHQTVLPSGGSAAYHNVTKIDRVLSVDWVTNPAAGGRVLRLASADRLSPTIDEDSTMLEQLIQAIKASGNRELIARLEALGAEPTSDAVIGIHRQLLEAVTRQQPTPAPAAPAPAATPAVVLEGESAAELLEVRRDGLTYFLESQLAGVALPDPAKARLKARIGKRIAEGVRGTLPTKDAITAEIAEDVALFGQLAEAGTIMPAAGVSRVSVTDRLEKIGQAFDDFFGVKAEGKDTAGQPIYALNPNARGPRSFRELYVEITGDTRISGRRAEAVRLSESLNSTSFDQALGDSITRRMLAEYAAVSQAQWRGTIAEVVPVNDFRTQRRIRFGGYPNLTTVSQGAPYPSLTSPTDEEATYAPAKRGGTEQITREMILNDDVGAIRRIPSRLARAASQTLYEFVFDMLRTNAVVYDGTALAAAGHNNNIVTSALSSSNVVTLRNAIKTMTDMSNGKRLGLSAKFLWHPVELEELAFQICAAARAVPNSGLAAQAEPAAPNFVNKIGIEPRLVDYWTDANDYWITADVSQTPMIELGFIGGREEPELFLQDQPNAGSMFSHDQLTYKLRHEYGGAVTDYRGFAAGIVP